jgi:hypothetical protein
MTSPDLIFLDQLDINRIQVNEKDYENKEYGYTYNYLNYQGVKDLEVQMPLYLTSNVGIKCWENEKGNSYNTMLQFPCIDGRQFDEDRTAKLLPDEQIPMKYDPVRKEIRPRTRPEIEREFQTFKQFCLIEDRGRQQRKISNDLRKFTWNGAIQVRNKRDSDDQIIEGEFHPPSIKFHINSKKTNRREIDLVCTNVETGQEVDYTEIKPFSTINAVFTLGRMHRKARSVPQPCGLHIYMSRVMFFPPSAERMEESKTDAEVPEEEERRRSNRFMSLPGEPPRRAEVENEKKILNNNPLTEPNIGSDTDTVDLNDDEMCRDEHRQNSMETPKKSPMCKGVC